MINPSDYPCRKQQSLLYLKVTHGKNNPNLKLILTSNIFREHQDPKKLRKMKLTSVGWGANYDEIRLVENGADSYLTSCMTDHNGPYPYNFKPCILPGVILQKIMSRKGKYSSAKNTT